MDKEHDGASPLGTKQFADKFSNANGFYRQTPHLMLSSVGMGTYLGDVDQDTDAALEEAIYRAVSEGGINVIDTAINYRGQLSERCVGRALSRLMKEGKVTRKNLFVSTKAGFIPVDAVKDWDREKIRMRWEEEYHIPHNEVVDWRHCIHPGALKASLQQSLVNLQISSVDVLYLHNVAESQLPYVNRLEFARRLEAAFTYLEEAKAQGLIHGYGMATWACFRVPPKDPQYVSLQEVVGIAKKVGGDNHGFRYLQLPLSKDMTEAWEGKWQHVEGHGSVTVLEAAEILGLTVMASKSIGVLKAELSDKAKDCVANIQGEGAKRLQLTRSIPGLTTALVGMKTTEHVTENLALVHVGPLTTQQVETCLLGKQGMSE